MKQLKLILCTAIFFAFSLKGDKMPYQLYDVKGKLTTYDKMLKEIIQKEKPDMIFFGEQHNNPICHWLELKLTEDLYAAYKDKMVMGAEMFESDDQLVVNEYLSGLISEKTFVDEVKEWSNYKTDYKPLLEFAKKNKLPFVGTNVPRRYANVVYNKGLAALDSIDSIAKKYIAPIPIRFNEHLKCYEDITKAAEGHNVENLAKSQAIKDATMAYFILKNWSKGNQSRKAYLLVSNDSPRKL